MYKVQIHKYYTVIKQEKLSFLSYQRTCISTLQDHLLRGTQAKSNDKNTFQMLLNSVSK